MIRIDVMNGSCNCLKWSEYCEAKTASEALDIAESLLLNPEWNADSGGVECVRFTYPDGTQTHWRAADFR